MINYKKVNKFGDNMNIVGYHGTLGTCAEQIINLNNFVESKSDEDLLSCGVYFYDNFENVI